ncbi:MAG: DUF1292 domain-containing protein [Lachnospiraceae bacterium]|nr:DUF1292 domain-containing protein [Lachnospiraceae bacterium]
MTDQNKKGLPEDADVNETEELGQIVLTLEDDSEVTCDIIATYPCTNGNSYIALLPVDAEGDDESDFYLYRYTVDDDGELILGDIDTDEEFEEASEAFDELLDEMDYDEMFGEEDE